jgi:uncharacterized cupin superfamily protein
MRRASLDEVEAHELGSEGHCTCRRLSDPLGSEKVAINHYRIAPGERLWGLHAHPDQEEVYLVTEGEITVETEAGATVVRANEAIRFAPGEFHCVRTDASSAALFALGAPGESEAIRVPIPCRECDRNATEPVVGDGGESVLRCPDCGAESGIECEDCGSERKRAVLAEDGQTILDACLDCGHESPVSRF